MLHPAKGEELHVRPCMPRRRRTRLSWSPMNLQHWRCLARGGWCLIIFVDECMDRGTRCSQPLTVARTTPRRTWCCHPYVRRKRRLREVEELAQGHRRGSGGARTRTQVSRAPNPTSSPLHLLGEACPLGHSPPRSPLVLGLQLGASPGHSSWKVRSPLCDSEGAQAPPPANIWRPSSYTFIWTKQESACFRM